MGSFSDNFLYLQVVLNFILSQPFQISVALTEFAVLSMQ